MRKKLLALLCCAAMLFSLSVPIDSKAVSSQGLETFSSPGYYTYTCTYSGIYEIECWGAAGGNDDAGGGPGSYISGFVFLEKGTVIKVCVGSEGRSGTSLGLTDFGGGGGTGGHGWSGQGGGASYCVMGSSYILSDYGYNNNDILVVAGAGGGGTCGVRGGSADSGSSGPMGHGGSKDPSGDSDGGGGGGGYRGGNEAPDGDQTQGGSSYVNPNRGYVGTHSKGTSWGAGMVRISLYGFSLTYDGNVPSVTESKLQNTMPNKLLIPGIPDYLDKNQYYLKGYLFQGWHTYPNAVGNYYYEDQALVIGN